MTRRIHPPLIGFAVLVGIFLMGPLVVVIGAALSGTTDLTFPPQGLSLRWFERVFEISAFRRTAIASLQIALLATTLALIIGIPAAVALNRYRIGLPMWLSTLFVLPVLVPEIVPGFSLLRSVAVGQGWPMFWTLLVGHTLNVLPLCVRVVSAGLAAFDFAIGAAAISLGSWCADRYGLRPVRVVQRAGPLRPGLICAHCLHVTPENIDAVTQASVTATHNARSNARAGRGIAPVVAMRAAGIPVGIATDGPMSGNPDAIVSAAERLAAEFRAEMARIDAAG